MCVWRKLVRCSFFFETEPPYVAQADLELLILAPLASLLLLLSGSTGA
jgi:hypothetical protein